VLVIGGNPTGNIVMGDVTVYATTTLDPRERQNRRDMLSLVRHTWLRGYLDPPLAGVALPTLSLQEQVPCRPTPPQ
jgi:hypothetical protein